MTIIERSNEVESGSGLELYWIPLGAGTTIGSRVVRVCGSTYERLTAAFHRRPAQALFHTALTARTPDGTWVVEMTPVPRHGSAEHRGVVSGGAVGSRRLARSRLFRYEVRRWLGGRIPDIGAAVASPVLISTDAEVVAQVLDLLEELPRAVWGRDDDHTGDMWNSNSVVSWTLARAGLVERAGAPPSGGRAPGWDAGLELARRGPTTAHRPVASPLIGVETNQLPRRPAPSTMLGAGDRAGSGRSRVAAPARRSGGAAGRPG
jgi:hypothetical protein